MEILIDTPKIQERLAVLAAEIDQFYSGAPYTVMPLLNGAMFFAVDLMRHLHGDFLVDSLAVSSYAGEHSTGEIRLRGDSKMSVEGRNVLVVDGVLDTGLTLTTVRKMLLERGARTVRSAVLVSKQVPRHPQAVGYVPDWVGFSLPDYFIVGCGMDADERYRALPFIARINNPDAAAEVSSGNE